MSERLIIGMSGSSATVLGVRLLEELGNMGVETHLIITDTARKIIEHETKYSSEDVMGLASQCYEQGDLFAPIASGSFMTRGMVVVPCSMKTLAGIASGYSDNLLLRAADVCLKERRRLVLVARETPLSSIHIQNMERVTQAGAIVLPPMMTYYNNPGTLADMEDTLIGKVLDSLGLENDLYARWG